MMLRFANLASSPAVIGNSLEEEETENINLKHQRSASFPYVGGTCHPHSVSRTGHDSTCHQDLYAQVPLMS